MGISEVFLLPFMQRALVAGLVAGILLGTMGVYVSMRNMSFLGDGIAHASLAGVALALLLGWMPTVVALVLALVLAVAIYGIERHSRISGDAAIGIIFTTGMALGVIFLHFTPGFQPDLISFLFGNILAISEQDLYITLGIGSLIMITTFAVSEKLTFVILDEEGAYLSGLNPSWYLLLLYIMTSLSIVLSIKLVGIVMVSALLITPSAMSQLLSRRFATFKWQSVFWACITIILGLVASVIFDLPSGATIIVVGSTLFLLTLLLTGRRSS